MSPSPPCYASLISAIHTGTTMASKQVIYSFIGEQALLGRHVRFEELKEGHFQLGFLANHCGCIFVAFLSVR